MRRGDEKENFESDKYFRFQHDLVVTGHVKIGNCTDLLYISAVLGVAKYLLCYRHHH